jgi:hypothetical protein
MAHLRSRRQLEVEVEEPRSVIEVEVLAVLLLAPIHIDQPETDLKAADKSPLLPALGSGGRGHAHKDRQNGGASEESCSIHGALLIS